MQGDQKAGEIPVLEYLVQALDVHVCREWVLQRLHPDGVYCPNCNKRITSDDALDSFWEERRTYCKSCGKQFTARTDTVIKRTNLDMREIFLFLVLRDLQVDNKKITETLGIHLDSVKNWKKRLEGL